VDGTMELLSVQKTALQAAKGKYGFAYFMEMGLGKTLTALTEFMELVAAKEATRLVVICPNSFKSGWADEIKKHNMDFHFHIFESGDDHATKTFLETDFNRPPVLIINYEAIRSHYTQSVIEFFTKKRNCMLVLDESIQIKTFDSLQTKAALKICTSFRYRRVMSGKPQTQGPHDLWAQLKAIDAMQSNYFPFKTTFCRMGGFKGKKVIGAQNEELLAAKVGSHIFWATKKEWTDLPSKLYTTRQYELGPVLEKHYKEMEDGFVTWLSETEYVSVEAFITKYIKLAQIQSGFIITEQGNVVELVSPEQNPRFKLVRDVMDETQSKIVVPYVHRYTRQILERVLKDFNPVTLHGGMKPSAIQSVKDTFNNDARYRAILVQIRAGKYGHTLLGGIGKDSCSTMVFAENSYSLDDRSQIEDRIHRHGQVAESCLYVDLWGTELDRRVAKALQDKEDMAQAVFSHFKLTRPSDNRITVP
jgi:SNF2 family DNA or RNA helicase